MTDKATEFLKAAGLNPPEGLTPSPDFKPTQVVATCPLCLDRGFLTSYSSNDLIPCECTKKKLALASAAKDGLTVGEYEHMRLDTYFPRTGKQIDALAACREQITKWRDGHAWEGLRLYSRQKGVGKTHLAIAMLYEAALQGKQVAMWTMSQLFTELMDTFSGRNGEYGELMRRAIETDVILLDDIGAEQRNSDFVLRTYFEVLDGRLTKHKTTILTSNLTLSEFNKQIGGNSQSERICSRIIALTGLHHIDLDGTDYRDPRNR